MRTCCCSNPACEKGCIADKETHVIAEALPVDTVPLPDSAFITEHQVTSRLDALDRKIDELTAAINNFADQLNKSLQHHLETLEGL